MGKPTGGRDWIVPELDLSMLWVDAGHFTMGSPPAEEGRDEDESERRVRLTKGFWLGKYEVTQGQWEILLERTGGSQRKSDRWLPVAYVSWHQAMGFCERLTMRERLEKRIPEGCTFTLPTEAQWEFACRAVSDTPFAYGRQLSSRKANFDGNFPYGTAPTGRFLGRVAPVGSYPHNPWGFYDMHGNVWEWCYDRYGVYSDGPIDDPAGSESGPNRVVRGGSWFDNAKYCRSAMRVQVNPKNRRENVGLRFALAPERS